MNIDRFLEFLKGHIKIRHRKILILDNLKVHPGKEVTKWVKKIKERIELFYLPAYSPDLNWEELSFTIMLSQI